MYFRSDVCMSYFARKSTQMPDCETGRQVANKARKPKHQQIANLKALTKVQESQVTTEALGEY